jgi:hypothetical protein
MNTEPMKTPRIQVSLSDPWDLGESLKWQPLCGVMLKVNIDAQGGRALVKFDQPVAYRGEFYQFAVAAPRHEGSSLKTLQDGGKVFCSFTAVSEEHAQSENALSTEHWRGGLAFIGDIEPLS